MCTVSEPIALAERNRLRKTTIHYLFAEGSADQFLFDDSDLFHDLEVVSIRSDANNESYLEALALYHSDIRSLTISQQQPLSDGAMQCLAKFKDLRYLDLRCPLKSPSLLLSVLPDRIEELQEQDSWNLPPLPKLRCLRINGGSLTADYMENLDIPRLQGLNLCSVNVAPGAFADAQRFKQLRELFVYDSSIDSAELEYLRRLPFLDTKISSRGMVHSSDW